LKSRRDLVHDRTRLTNRITNALKAYFPQVLEWFRDKDSAVFADFLERWPTLEAAQRARKDTLEAFFRTSNVRRTATIKRRIDAIREERPLHSDDAVTIPARMLVDALLPQLRALSASIARFDEEIARLASQLPDYELFAALPGAGPTLAPRLLAAFGERRAVPRRRCATEVRRNHPRHRAQWQQVLGPLALQLQQVPAPDLCRVGSSNHPALLLG
jgi:transposase